MDKLALVARLLLGLAFVVFGLNGFLEFIEPPEQGPEATAFMGALVDSGYMLPLIKVTEIACGALLVLGVFAPLALTVLAPIQINILAYHLGFSATGVELSIALIALHLFLAFAYRERFAGVLSLRGRSSEGS